MRGGVLGWTFWVMILQQLMFYLNMILLVGEMNLVKRSLRECVFVMTMLNAVGEDVIEREGKTF